MGHERGCKGLGYNAKVKCQLNETLDKHIREVKVFPCRRMSDILRQERGFRRETGLRLEMTNSDLLRW